MLERIVYISAGAEKQSRQAIDRILSVSRSRNAAAGLTGLLIGGGNWWMQVLEGERPALEPVWTSIRNDPRHSPVVLVQRRPLCSRAFPDWAMQFQRSDNEGFVARLEELTGGIGDAKLKDQVQRFHRLFLQTPDRAWSKAAA